MAPSTPRSGSSIRLRSVRQANDQPSFAEIAAEAHRHGMQALHLPVISGRIKTADCDAFAAQYTVAPEPMLGFCRTGIRADSLWADTQERLPDESWLGRPAAIRRRLRSMVQSILGSSLFTVATSGVSSRGRLCSGSSWSAQSRLWHG